MLYKNPVRQLHQELDAYPFPDRELYKRYPFIVNQNNLRIITMRGCPYPCSFCFHHSMRKIFEGKGKYVRRRSIPNVIAELKECVSKYSYKRVDFQDDTFTLDVNTWLKEFLVEYKKEIGLPFTCTVRANGLDDELIRLLAQAGCHAVKMGMETDDEHLNNAVLKRGMTKKLIYHAMDLFKKNGVKVETFNLIGIPGEKIQQAIDTMSLNAELKVDFARVALVQPYPKTDLEAYAKENGYLDKNYDVDDYENSYFIATPIKLEDKDQFINLQRLFGYGVKFPKMIPLIKKLIKLPPNKVYDLAFKLDYAYSVRMLDKVSIKDFFNLVCVLRDIFPRKKLVLKVHYINNYPLSLSLKYLLVYLHVFFFNGM
jgi:anaerobic magnesium-protoporphyrin IX monomethyl ester cyclase